MLTKNLTRAALLAAIMAACPTANAAVDPDQSRIQPPAGDGWQLLSPSTPTATAAASAPASASIKSAPPLLASAKLPSATPGSLAVASVQLPDNSPPPMVLLFSISPKDTNLRNALDRWLQQQGYQLAWRIDDDLPLEFNASFSGDFASVLRQVMLATNNMRTPARVCRHSNRVIRVIARAASCKE